GPDPEDPIDEDKAVLGPVAGRFRSGQKFRQFFCGEFRQIFRVIGKMKGDTPAPRFEMARYDEGVPAVVAFAAEDLGGGWFGKEVDDRLGAAASRFVHVGLGINAGGKEAAL